MRRPISHIHQRWIQFTNGSPAQARPLSPAAQLACAGALLVLTLTLIEPASAVGLPWWQQAAFQAAHIAPGMALAWVVSGWLFERAALRRWPGWALLALAGAVAGAVLVPWSVALEMALGVVDLDEPGSAPLPHTAEAWWREVSEEWLHVPPRTALLWMAMNQWVLWRTRQPEALQPTAPEPGGPPAPKPDRTPDPAPDLGVAPDPAPAPDVAPDLSTPPTPPAPPAGPSLAKGTGLLAQLPARLGRDIVHLESQQHYLRVVTTRGEHLLLHGLGTAMAELAARGISGAQIHRSVWVAWAHVEKLDLRSTAPAAVLRGGQRLPIGRRRLREVAEAWHQWPGA
ncbi:MAG: LytTR family DNA-binding domain-containing protein [Inhella sp.]|jgi:hypothetical protein|uniref:LytTR family DNA-binding domain-containing protein n=1 Tax=Inhella sp. TaxID=1921806 RepID=UPI0022CCBCB0|nr:LytTR family DNA-binding domain-containing protein [Inhella sp.]MCZ8234397.1 LytTR family DNA-binding domain-containing protein [Inhella sp.]